MRALSKFTRELSGFCSLAYLPAVLICGTDPNPKPGKSVKMPHVAPGTKPINKPRPMYPLEARQQHLEGTMLLDLDVRQGSVADVKVVQSTGHALLDQGG